MESGEDSKDSTSVLPAGKCFLRKLRLNLRTVAHPWFVLKLVDEYLTTGVII